MLFSFIKQKLSTLANTKNIFFRPQNESRKKQRRLVFLVVLIIFFLFSLHIQHASASWYDWPFGETNFLKSTLANFLLPLLSIILEFCKMFVGLAAGFLQEMLRPDLYDFTKQTIIQTGWEMVRNVCNMFFLILLLFIAFCTILQIDKYHAKKTLLTLIIMALLINFSKPITVFIFDSSQLLMNFFLKSEEMTQDGGYPATITEISNIAKMIYDNTTTFWAWATSSNSAELAVRDLFAIVFLFMLGVAYISTGLYLLIRIVAMWILIILSPLAFLATAIPDFKSMASSWWNALFKYSFVGPAMIFFLWLSTFLFRSEFLNKISKTKASVISMDQFIAYLVVVIFLYASIIMGQRFGIQFASTITGAADRTLKWGIGTFTGYRAARWTGRKAWQGTKFATKKGLNWFDYTVLAPAGISPKAIKEGWSRQAKEQEDLKRSQAAAAWEDKWNKIFGHKKPPRYKENLQFEAEADKYTREQRSVSVQDSALLGLIKDFKDSDSQEAKAKTAVALRLLFENNDQNEFMKQYILENHKFFDKRIQKMLENRLLREGKKINDETGVMETDTEFYRRIKKEKRKAKLDPNDPNAAHNPDTLRAALEYVMRRNFEGGDENWQNFGKSDKNDDHIGRQLFQLGTIALPRGNHNNYGMGHFDARANSYRISDSATNMAYGLAKTVNINSQEKMRTLHWNTLFNEVPIYEDKIDPETGQVEIDPETGKPKQVCTGKMVGDIHKQGYEQLCLLSDTDAHWAGLRGRPDLLSNAHKGRKKLLEAAVRMAQESVDLENKVVELQAKADDLRKQGDARGAANVGKKVELLSQKARDRKASSGVVMNLVQNIETRVGTSESERDALIGATRERVNRILGVDQQQQQQAAPAPLPPQPKKKKKPPMPAGYEDVEYPEDASIEYPKPKEVGAEHPEDV